jgi:hypothetical protein
MAVTPIISLHTSSDGTLRITEDDSRKQTDAEEEAGIIPVNYAYAPDFPVIDLRRYGILEGDVDANATVNDVVIANAITIAVRLGGAVIQFPAGTYCTSVAHIVPMLVSIRGMGQYTTIVKKTSNTASTEAESTTPRYGGAITTVIAVFHFVTDIGGSLFNYSGACVRDIAVCGDDPNPNTSVVTYGFFFHGVTNAKVVDTRAFGVKVGYYFGNGANITSEISGNRAEDVQRGFYIESGTSLSYHHNYVNRYRYRGHDLSSYYTHFMANGADHGGDSSVRVADTEVCLAYKFHSCRSCLISNNGIEIHNGPIWEISSCRGVVIANNLCLELTSDHDNATSGLDIYGFFLDGNIDIIVEDNLTVFATTQLSGDAVAGDHHNYGTGTTFGYHIFRRNQFLDTIADTTEGGWGNNTGALSSADYVGSYTGSETGCTTTPTGDITWSRNGDLVTLRFPTITGTSNTTACTITGMPAEIRPLTQQVLVARITDNNVIGFGVVIVETSGVLTLGVGAAAGAFTNVNTKGIPAGSIAYRLS